MPNLPIFRKRRTGRRSLVLRPRARDSGIGAALGHWAPAGATVRLTPAHISSNFGPIPQRVVCPISVVSIGLRFFERTSSPRPFSCEVVRLNTDNEACESFRSTHRVVRTRSTGFRLRVQSIWLWEFPATHLRHHSESTRIPVLISGHGTAFAVESFRRLQQIGRRGPRRRGLPKGGRRF